MRPKRILAEWDDDQLGGKETEDGLLLALGVFGAQVRRCLCGLAVGTGKAEGILGWNGEIVASERLTEERERVSCRQSSHVRSELQFLPGSPA